MGKIQLTENQYERLKKRLINEVDTGKLLSNTAQGALIGSTILPGAGAPIGAAIGAAYSLISGSSGSKNGVEKIFDSCSKSGMGKSTMNDTTLDSITSDLRDMQGAYGYNTDEDLLKSALSKIQTIPDLCAVVQRYSENYPGDDLFDDINTQIDDDDEWNQYVYLPLLKAKRKTESLSKGAISQGTELVAKSANKATSDKLWYNFPCVPSNSGAKSAQMSNGSTVYTIGTEKYYNNGRMKKSDGTMVNYYCDTNNKIVVGNKPTGGKSTSQKTYSKPKVTSKAADYLD